MGIFAIYPLLKIRRVSISVPSGLIVLYNGTSAPDGWSLFTSADGKFIIGAGNTYSVEATGGSTSITTGSSDTQGAHEGTSYIDTGSAYGDYAGNYSAGGHSHTLTYDYTPPYYGLRLIKADSDLLKLPPKAVMFSGESMSSLSRFSSGDGTLFSARSSIGSGGSNTIGATASSSAGAHAHGDNKSSSTGGPPTANAAALTGNHTHNNSSFVITPNLKRALLSAWTNVSIEFNLEIGMYGFWLSTVSIPTGWALCDGNNGTLDLRDYFIEFADEDSDGGRTGNGTISVPNITLATESWSHHHKSSDLSPATRSNRHDTYSASHSHTISSATPTFLPPYYALAIIKCTG